MLSYTHTIRVRYPDTDQMGVVYHGVYLEFFETARTELLRDHGMPYSDLEKSGLMLPVLAAALTIKRPARYDELVAVTARIQKPSGARLHIEYDCRREDELLVTGSTEHVFARTEDMSPVRPPRSFMDLFDSLTSERTP